jgi:ankyrin repeat protein
MHFWLLNPDDTRVLEAISNLVKLKADINQKNADGDTPLQLAFRCIFKNEQIHRKIIKTLLENRNSR